MITYIKTRYINIRVSKMLVQVKTERGKKELKASPGKNAANHNNHEQRKKNG